MAKRTTLLIAALGFLACSPARAIPPPWSIEEWKGKADLILIATTTRVEAVENVRGADHRIGLQPVEILKGTIAKKDQKEGKGKDTQSGEARLYLLFHKPPEPKGPIRRHAVGGTGHPRPGQREFALVFLKTDPKEAHFRAACGAFGYIALTAPTPDKKAGVKKRIEGYRRWCQRIKDETIRKAMDGYYQRALTFLANAATLRGTVIRKPWSKTYESWNAGGSEYYVLDVGAAAIPPGKRSAKEGVILRPSKLIGFGAFKEHKGKSVVVRGRFVEGKPYRAPAGATEQQPAGATHRGSGFRVYEIRPAKQDKGKASP